MAKGKPKVGQPTAPAAASSPSSSQPAAKGKKGLKTEAASAVPDASAKPAKPTVKQMIGGASWTGKLPVNLLSEHCQKQRWHKPEYETRKTADGFSVWITLSAKDVKTQQLVKLEPFKIPLSHKHLILRDTALEAKHAAATYALFRVCSMQNKHTVLPPDHKSLWKEFQALKTQDVKDGKAWMYDADPFKTLLDRQEAKAASEKKRIELEAAKAKAKEMPGASGLVLLHASASASGLGSNPMKGWTEAPKVEMGKQTRIQLEALLRTGVSWNPHGVRMSQEQKNSVVTELSKLGFRRSHVAEAVDYCKDREETLEWLLVHVPEDDLPRWALPERYSAGISVGTTDLKREAIIQSLSETGYSLELCARILDENGGDEDRAAEHLQAILLSTASSDEATDPATADFLEMGSPEEQWEEEVGSLESMYGGKFQREGKTVIRIRLESVKNAQMTGQGEVEAFLQVRRPPSYPKHLILSIAAKLPSYIKLSVVRRALAYMKESLADEPMKIYLVLDWVQQHINGIINDPGRLVDISAVSSAASESSTRPAPAPASRWRPRGPPKNIRREPDPRLREEWLLRQESPAWKASLSRRQQLPAWQVREQIVRTVSQHHVTIISGETGSGKSTQSVQFLLDDLYSRGLGGGANIIVTQPRRISALGLADRVAEERCTRVGDEVGYAIRGESRQGRETRITFVTTGVLLRRLQTSGGRIEDVAASLADVSHVILDEVHERSLDTDFLLNLLREVLRMNKEAPLKLVLMSATLDAATFANYFASEWLSVGTVEIAGRTFPVDEYYLDDVIRLTGYGAEASDKGHISEEKMGKIIQKLGHRINYGLIAEVVEAVDCELAYEGKPGGILIFLPGVGEINQACNNLRWMSSLHVLPLHASLETREQRRVFAKPPAGKRKVVVATNVAETSITIDDIVVVIDSGKVKETSFDAQSNMRKLEERWASRAACRQRRGRAGRVQEGQCYRLYTQVLEGQMAERPEPEMRRVPLEQLCLSVRAMGMREVDRFLERSPTPPEGRAVEGAMRLLRRMGALDGDELTAMGQQLAMLPADLRCGKLMVFGAMFGCLDDCVTMAAILSTKSPFVSPQEKREEAREARQRFSDGDGDLMTDLEAYASWDELVSSGARAGEVRAFCEESFLSQQTLGDIANTRVQFYAALSELGIVAPSMTSMTPATRTRTRTRTRAAPTTTTTPPATTTTTTATTTTTTTTTTPMPGTTPTPAPARARRRRQLLRALIASALSPQVARIQYPDKKFANSMSGAVELDPEARSIKYFNEDRGRVFLHPGSTLFGSQAFSGHAVCLSYFGIMATSKVFIRDLTPLNAYTLLLFGGRVELDTLGRGLVVDGWIRLRGWARIGVLVARLRGMVDDLVGQQMENPGLDLQGSRVMQMVTKLVELNGLDA